MSEHEELRQEIPALAAGRLEGWARQRIEDHLAACFSCADLFEMARDIADAGRENPSILSPHPDIQALRAHAQGRPDAGIDRHLEMCPSCALETESWNRNLETVARSTAAPRASRARWYPLTAALAAGLVLGLLVPRLLAPGARPALPPRTTDWAGQAGGLVLWDSMRGGSSQPVLVLREGQPVVPIVVYLELADSPAEVGPLTFELNAEGAAPWSFEVPAGDSPFTFLIPVSRLLPGVNTLTVKRTRHPDRPPLLEKPFEVVAPHFQSPAATNEPQ